MIRRTLMKRNQELADFEVDPTTGEASVIDVSETCNELSSFAEPTKTNPNRIIRNLVRSRTISHARPDKNSILAAFGAKSAQDLALKGHGLSLSDQYWYRAPGSTERWEDVNFFDNEWDQAFGAAVLAGDYSRLATCSLDVPDATTGGQAVKAWERNAEGCISLVKASERFEGADLMGAKLASDLCAALFEEGCYVPLSIVERNGRSCSSEPLMLASDEELADGNQLCAIAGKPEAFDPKEGITAELCNSRIKLYEAFDIADASAHVARLACCSCLTVLADFHGGNFGAIRRVGSDAWRAAPVFDYDGSFGFPFNDDSIVKMSANPLIAKLLCAFTFSYLDPSWDWSWYDPQALEGFENHILEAYAPYRCLPPSFADLVAHLYIDQRNYVNDIATAHLR